MPTTIELGEIPGRVFADHGYIYPLEPDVLYQDLDGRVMVDLTERLHSSGYRPERSVRFVEAPEAGTRVIDLALSTLFKGNASRSRESYESFLASNSHVIGPYFSASADTNHIRGGIAIWEDPRSGVRRKHGDVSWGILGAGRIGSRVIEQLADPEIASRSGLSVVPDFVLRKTSGLHLPQEDRAITLEEVTNLTEEDRTIALEEVTNLPDVDILFIATPPELEGEENPALRHIRRQLARNRSVVTAEKASLAANFSEMRDLSDNFTRLGINATVGGGTRMLDVLAPYMTDLKNVTELHVALNGTLAFIMSQVANGIAPGVAVDEAIALKYAERGASGAENVIREEATGDIPRKLAILMNKLLLSDDQAQSGNFQFELSDREIRQALREAGDRRFIISIYNANRLNGSLEEIEGGVIGNLMHQYEEWVVVGGFKRVRDNPLTVPFSHMQGANIGAVLGLGPDNQDGVYSLNGPGAGAKPTANAMLDDAQKIITSLSSDTL